MSWESFDFVLFFHPDVYLLPRAVAAIDSVLHRRSESGALFVTRGPFRYIQHVHYNTDIFAFRRGRQPHHVWRAFWDGLCALCRNGNSCGPVATPESCFYAHVNKQSAVPFVELGDRFVPRTNASLVFAGRVEDEVWRAVHSHSTQKMAAHLSAVEDTYRLSHPSAHAQGR